MTDMNCDDYKEAIAARPDGGFDGGPEHAAGCADCRALAADYRALDARIARALAIEVPPLSLPPLADTAEVVAIRPRRRVPQPAWFGLAAGLALAAFFGLQFAERGTSDLSLPEQVIAHLDHEQDSRVATDVAVSERTLESVVNNDVELRSGIGLVTYARSCVINGKVIPHLVVQGERGPVTLLLMPDEPVDGPIPLEGKAVNGIILPVGDGSIAIVGERDEPLDVIEERVIDSVKWKT